MAGVKRWITALLLPRGEIALIDGEISTEHAAPVRTRMVWYRVDPLAVHLRFALGLRRRHVDWTISRELLAAGLLMPTGDGDVCLTPYPNGVVLELCPPGARAALLMNPDDIGTYLTSTYQQVPIGEESTEIDDNALYALTKEW